MDPGLSLEDGTPSGAAGAWLTSRWCYSMRHQPSALHLNIEGVHALKAIIRSRSADGGTVTFRASKTDQQGTSDLPTPLAPPKNRSSASVSSSSLSDSSWSSGAGPWNPGSRAAAADTRRAPIRLLAGAAIVWW